MKRISVDSSGTFNLVLGGHADFPEENAEKASSIAEIARSIDRAFRTSPAVRILIDDLHRNDQDGERLTLSYLLHAEAGIGVPA